MKANILLTCCGRKTYLVEIFRSSPLCGVVAAADKDPRATIRHYVDHFVRTPTLSDEDAYIERLLEACETLAIHAVIPQNDLDLIVLAAHRGRFESAGVRVLGVPLHVATAMADKLESARWFAKHGIPSPRTGLYVGQPVGLPVVAKSRVGQGSHGLRICYTADELQSVTKNSVVQELLQGDEYNLDVLRDDFGTEPAVVVKKKLAMHHGSTDKAVSVRDRRLETLGAQLGHALELEGSADIDVFVTDEGPFVIDVNSRVGGGFPFTAQICPGYVDGLLMIALHRRSPAVGNYGEGIEIHRESRYYKVPES